MDLVQQPLVIGGLNEILEAGSVSPGEEHVGFVEYSVRKSTLFLWDSLVKNQLDSSRPDGPFRRNRRIENCLSSKNPKPSKHRTRKIASDCG